MGSVGFSFKKWPRWAVHALLLGAAATSLIAANLVPTTAVATGVAAGGSSSTLSGVTASDWPSYLDGSLHTSINTSATSITTANIADLNPVWSTLTTVNFYSSPVAVGGIVYVGGQNGDFYAFDEATQTVVWSQFLGRVLGTSCGPGNRGFTSTASVATDPSTGDLTVYVNAPDGHMYALDAATGAVDWESVVGIPSTTVNDYYAWGSPLVVNGKVYVGISSECDQPLVPAGLLAFDQSTGAQVGFWNSLPSLPAGSIGGSIWSTPAALRNGSIIATTGNDQGSAQGLWADSLVQLTPLLKLHSGWQIPPAQQIPDGDFGGSPTVFTAKVNGVATTLVGACDKDGSYYALRASDPGAGPVWSYAVTAPWSGDASGECDAAAIWNGKMLIEGGGAPTTINGVSYPGSVQALNPSTGDPIWQTGIPGQVIGSPSEDGAGVVAAPVYTSATGNNGVYLLNGKTGAIIGFISTPAGLVFGQPVFDGSELLVDGTTGGITSYQITTPGPPITSVAPSTLGANTSDTVVLTGSGFSGTPSVRFPGTLVTVHSVHVTSPTTIKVVLSVAKNAPAGTAGVEVLEPGLVTDTCANCLTITNS
jgi:polyvinyl alcohol dehydrogenase (cytochrome)